MKDNKINVELLVPSIKEKYNISIPVSKTIGEVIIILNKTINLQKKLKILSRCLDKRWQR